MAAMPFRMRFRLDGVDGVGLYEVSARRDRWHPDQGRDLRLRRRPDDAAAGLVRGGPGRDRDHGRGLGRAMQRIAERDGEHPLYELERGRITETEFLAALGASSRTELGHEPELHRFSEIYFEALDPNEPMIELMRAPRARGYRMALLTNNVREWEPLWRAMLPVDEIFEVIVDSGVRRDAKARAARSTS